MYKMNKLDKINRKLLIILNKNARLSHNQLGKLAGVSRDRARYRIQQMEKEGIITGYITHVQNRLFGVENYWLSIKLQNLPESSEKSISEKLREVREIKFLLSCQGEYDFVILCGAKNKIHLCQIFDKISAICGKSLIEINLDIYVKTLKFESYGFLLPEFSYAMDESKKYTGEKPDRYDIKIIRELLKNAKSPIIDIAEKSGLTAETVSKRIKHLRKTKAITNIIASIDYSKIGYERYLLYIKLHSYSYKAEKKFREVINNIDKAVHAERVLGAWDIKCMIISENYEEFLKVLKIIKSHLERSLLRYDVLLITKEVKREPYLGKASED